MSDNQAIGQQMYFKRMIIKYFYYVDPKYTKKCINMK